MTATIPNPEPYTIFDQQGQEWLGYDSIDRYYSKSDLPQLIADYGEEDYIVEQVREHGSYFDSDGDAQDIEDLNDNLTEWMNQIIKETPDAVDGYWCGESRNFGWLHQDGYTPALKASDGQQLLQAVLPNTECTFKIYRCQDAQGHPGIALNNAHHDAPMGGEIYYLFPLREEDEEEAEGEGNR